MQLEVPGAEVNIAQSVLLLVEVKLLFHLVMKTRIMVTENIRKRRIVKAGMIKRR